MCTRKIVHIENTTTLMMPCYKATASILEARRLSKRFTRLCILVSFSILLWILSYKTQENIPLVRDTYENTTLLLVQPKEDFPMVWDRNLNRSTKLLITPDENTTLIQSKVCQGRTVPFLLVMVFSAVENYAAREAIRASWAMDQMTIKTVSVVFLVGQLLNMTSYPRLHEESKQHGDIIQEDFIDSYANLTIKSLMMLKWVTLNCDINNKSNSVEYVLKTDDDMYVNLVKLHEVAQSNRKPNLLLGYVIKNAVPIKDPHNKWFVPGYMFNQTKFPTYISGTGYLMQRSTISELYKAAMDTPVFHLEDIYITGILASKVGIKPENSVLFSMGRRQLDYCSFNQSITTHHMELSEMKTIYKLIQSSKNETCS